MFCHTTIICRVCIPDIRRFAVSAVEDARKTPVRVIPTEFGPLPGQTVEQIVSLAVEILRHVRYIDVEATFDSLCNLYLETESDVERETLLQLAEDLSKYELRVWNEVGPLVQSTLVDKFKMLEIDLLGPLKPILLRCLAEILKSEVRGISFTYEVANIQTGPDPNERCTRTCSKQTQLVYSSNFIEQL